VRVVTWNVWWRFGDWASRLAAIRHVLGDCGADVVCLQEVWASGCDNQAALLAERLGLHSAWAASPAPARWQRRIGDDSVEIGNAILSRSPIEAQHSLPLPDAPGLDEGRHALIAMLGGRSGPLAVITTQLASPPHLSALRVAQVRRLAIWAAGLVPVELPLVVTGDFNALPESDEVRRFEGHLTAPIVPGRVLLDAWRYADHLDPGFTWSRRNPHVAATFEIDARIDYVFVGPPGADGHGHVRSVGLAGDRPVDGTWPSDHAAVVVDLAD
jgi:endonuclease/exonuclease/phosphatase family metal-dependent hydrolase